MSETIQRTGATEPISWRSQVAVLVIFYLIGFGLVFLSPSEQWTMLAAQWTGVFLLTGFLGALAHRDRITHPLSEDLVRSRLRIYGAVLVVAGLALMISGALLYDNVFTFPLTPGLWILGFIQIWRPFGSR
jgi:tetrahydromethanopterin S-methyltransferase subunit E